MMNTTVWKWKVQETSPDKNLDDKIHANDRLFIACVTIPSVL